MLVSRSGIPVRQSPCGRRSRGNASRLRVTQLTTTGTVQRLGSVRKDASHRCAAAAESAPPVEQQQTEFGSVVVIDNYDSFTYNLSQVTSSQSSPLTPNQYLGELGCKHTVIYNDAKTVSEIKKMKPRGILISPGPGRPEDSGITLTLIEEMAEELPIMGVCMGHQCMAQVFGGHIIRNPFGVMHGRSSEVHHNEEGLLKGLPKLMPLWKSSFPKELEMTAWTHDGTIMGIRHKELRHLQSVQFHPESIITDYGKKIIQNFIDSLEE